MAAHPYSGLHTCIPRTFLTPPTMTSMSKRPKGRDGVLVTLDLVIQGLGLAKDTCGIPPAQVAFAAASVLLAMIRVSFPLCTV